MRSVYTIYGQSLSYQDTVRYNFRRTSGILQFHTQNDYTVAVDLIVSILFANSRHGIEGSIHPDSQP
jgi:hypothetical protein